MTLTKKICILFVGTCAVTSTGVFVSYLTSSPQKRTFNKGKQNTYIWDGSDGGGLAL